MNRYDGYIIISVLVLAILSATWLFSNGESVDQQYVVVRVDGKEINRVSLDDDQQLLIEGKAGISTVEIKDGKARMVEAVCQDQICINSGRISRVGQSIICLPERISVVIDGVDDELDTVVY